jgi:hypothetical protein
MSCRGEWKGTEAARRVGFASVPRAPAKDGR